VGGLINAYRTSAKLAIESSVIVKKTIDILYQLNFEYDLMSKVMKIIKENSIVIQSQKLELDCEIIISVRKSEAIKMNQIFENIYKVEIRSLEV